VLARRQELDLTQLDVWQAGGPSNTTLTKIENAEIDTLTRTTARKLDAGLQWVAGSAKGVYESGAAPRPIAAALRGMSQRGARWLMDQIESAEVPAETRAELLEVLRERGTA
ncbi:MAG: hypothetical protein CMJ18_07850, partial [Phycisphaeraceae bacterium]|nr:hypothetical protein [Phycisphaeraceae bacterium]